MEIAKEDNSGEEKDDEEVDYENTDDENYCKSAGGAYTSELLASLTICKFEAANIFIGLTIL